MTQANPKASKHRSVFSWGLAGFDLLLVLGALIAGSLIWFIPAFWDTPELRAFYEQQRQLKAQHLALEAEEARIQKENDELGIIYIQPGENPFPTKPPQSAGKPAPKSPAKPTSKKEGD